MIFFDKLKIVRYLNRRKRERYSKSLEGLFLFTYFDSQAQWSLPLSSHGLAYPYFQISLCIKETASTTWLNLEFNQKNVAGERNMGIIVLRTKLHTDGRNARKEKKKKASERTNENLYVSSLIIFPLESFRNLSNIYIVRIINSHESIVNWSNIDRNWK